MGLNIDKYAYLSDGIDLATRLGGRIALTSALHSDRSLMSDPGLYKLIWVVEGSVTVTIDHVDTVLALSEAVTLSPLQQFGFRRVEGSYRALLFNSSFYCIFGHDDEVSCNGLLFNGSSRIPRFVLSPAALSRLDALAYAFLNEYRIGDDLREEMLRIHLKQTIIFFTRLARQRFAPVQDKEPGYEIVRRFHILVDSHFREKKLVQDYASMLNRSPKTLTNMFAGYGLPSPMRIIHERIAAEAKRLLLHTEKSAKEISALLGFEEQSSFSRFFKRETSRSITDFRKSAAGNN